MLDFEIDKLTNSIEHALSGEVFQTDVILVAKPERALKKSLWIFDWKSELRTPGRLIYKLIAPEISKTVHGLLSISIREDHVYIHLIENAKFNMGRDKHYIGVAGNLIAYACKVAFEFGFEGSVVFESKTRLISHYQQAIGAKILAGNKLFIDTIEAKQLVDRYFK